MNADVTRPRDLLGASLRELLDDYQRHTSALVNARHGIGDPQPPARLARHALDALACGQALADHLMNMRWVTVADALAYGATLEQTAAAMGLDPDEVAAGLRSWADGQHAHAGVSAAARDEVYALLGRALHLSDDEVTR